MSKIEGVADFEEELAKLIARALRIEGEKTIAEYTLYQLTKLMEYGDGKYQEEMKVNFDESKKQKHPEDTE